MRMPGMSDEELDALFRRGAEAYPDEVHLGAWTRMEDKLNEDAVNRLLRRKIVRFFALELVLVGLALLVWQLAGRPFTSITAADTKAVPAAIVQPSERAAMSRTQRKASLGSPSSRRTLPAYQPKVISAPVASNTASSQKPASSPEPSSAAKPASSTFQAPRNQLSVNSKTSRVKRGWLLPTKPRHPVAAHENQTPFPNNTAAVPLVAAGSAQTDRETNPVEPDNAAETTPPQAAATPPAPASPKASLPELPAIPPPTATADTTAQNATPAADSAETQQRVRPAYRLLIGALGAPSLSAVRSVQTARMGGDLGLSLEYRLTNRLRLRASVIRSVKRYKVESEYYIPPASWGWRPGNYEVNGNCRITEIPLDLRYDLISHPRHTVFFSLGMNSLLMRNERYSYDYYAYGQLRTAAVKVENGANFVLSVVNLSTGAERQLGNHLSVQAEPFIQLPLGGVGAARVRLSSAGLLFSLKYGLLPARRALAP